MQFFDDLRLLVGQEKGGAYQLMPRVISAERQI